MSEVGAHEDIPPLRPLREVVEVALRAADWVDPKVDGAVIELARYYAGLVDGAHASGDLVLFQKAMGVAAPNLHKALTSLGLTPQSRGTVKSDGEAPSVDPFDELKKRRARAEAKKEA